MKFSDALMAGRSAIFKRGKTSNVQRSTSNVQFQKGARHSFIRRWTLGVGRWTFSPSHVAACSRTDASFPRAPVLSPPREDAPLAIAPHSPPRDRCVRSHLRLDELVLGEARLRQRMARSRFAGTA